MPTLNECIEMIGLFFFYRNAWGKSIIHFRPSLGCFGDAFFWFSFPLSVQVRKTNYLKTETLVEHGHWSKNLLLMHTVLNPTLRYLLWYPQHRECKTGSKNRTHSLCKAFVSSKENLQISRHPWSFLFPSLLPAEQAHANLSFLESNFPFYDIKHF